MTTPAHLTPEPSGDRGFKRLPPITDSYRSTSVRVYESSAAEDPRLWLTVTPPDATTEVFAHLTADDAWRLKEQIEWLLEHHYQGDARPPSAVPRMNVTRGPRSAG